MQFVVSIAGSTGVSSKELELKACEELETTESGFAIGSSVGPTTGSPARGSRSIGSMVCSLELLESNSISTVSELLGMSTITWLELDGSCSFGCVTASLEVGEGSAGVVAGPAGLLLSSLQALKAVAAAIPSMAARPFVVAFVHLVVAVNFLFSIFMVRSPLPIK